jgi:GNAT superfamily N-acetyltransferase
MAFEWKHSTDGVDWEELSSLYRAAPLGDRKASHLQKVFPFVAAPEPLMLSHPVRTATVPGNCASMPNSMFKWFVYENARLIGAGRALADGEDCSYLCDIAVLPSHQGTGLGKQIVAYLVEQSRGHRKIILYAQYRARRPFYRKFGFLRMKTAMAIFENQQQQLERGYLSEA